MISRHLLYVRHVVYTPPHTPPHINLYDTNFMKVNIEWISHFTLLRESGTRSRLSLSPRFILIIFIFLSYNPFSLSLYYIILLIFLFFFRNILSKLIILIFKFRLFIIFPLFCFSSFLFHRLLNLWSRVLTSFPP